MLAGLCPILGASREPILAPSAAGRASRTGTMDCGDMRSGRAVPPPSALARQP